MLCSNQQKSLQQIFYGLLLRMDSPRMKMNQTKPNRIGTIPPRRCVRIAVAILHRRSCNVPSWVPSLLKRAIRKTCSAHRLCSLLPFTKRESRRNWFMVPRMSIASRKSLASVPSSMGEWYATLMSTMCAQRPVTWMLHRMFHMEMKGEPSHRMDEIIALRVCRGSKGASRNITSMGSTHVRIASADVRQG